MTITTGSIVLNAPVEAVWALYRDFGALQWFSGAAGCRIENGKASDQIGAVRMVEMAGAPGFVVPERLVGLSDDAHVLEYAIDLGTDLGAVKAAPGTKARIELYPIAHSGGTFVRMVHTYTVTEGDPAVLVEFMQGVYQQFYADLTRAFPG